MRDFYTNPGASRRTYGGVIVSQEEIQRLREVPLVPWAKFKCRDCGSTICESPLPHNCALESFGVGDYGRCLL